MAASVTKFKVDQAEGILVLRGVLLDGVAATSNGEWFDVSGFSAFSVQISGITTATVKVCVSNKPTQPDATDHGIEKGSLTADGSVEIICSYRWIKARISAWTTGSISAWLAGVCK